MPYHTPLSNHFSLMVAQLDRDSFGSPFNRANSMKFLLSIDGRKLYSLDETGQLTSFAKNGIISLVLEVGSRCPYILKVSKWTVSWEKNEKDSVHKQKVIAGRLQTKVAGNWATYWREYECFHPTTFQYSCISYVIYEEKHGTKSLNREAWFFHMLGSKTLLFKKMNISPLAAITFTTKNTIWQPLSMK